MIFGEKINEDTLFDKRQKLTEKDQDKIIAFINSVNRNGIRTAILGYSDTISIVKYKSKTGISIAPKTLIFEYSSSRPEYLDAIKERQFNFWSIYEIFKLNDGSGFACTAKPLCQRGKKFIPTYDDLWDKTIAEKEELAQQHGLKLDDTVDNGATIYDLVMYPESYVDYTDTYLFYLNGIPE